MSSAGNIGDSNIDPEAARRAAEAAAKASEEGGKTGKTGSADRAMTPDAVRNAKKTGRGTGVEKAAIGPVGDAIKLAEGKKRLAGSAAHTVLVSLLKTQLNAHQGPLEVLGDSSPEAIKGLLMPAFKALEPGELSTMAKGAVALADPDAQLAILEGLLESEGFTTSLQEAVMDLMGSTDKMGALATALQPGKE